jgi:hypothetical protein
MSEHDGKRQSTQAPPAHRIEDAAADQVGFRLVLDQYNRHLGFTIDMSQKCIAMALTFAGIFYALHKGDTSTDKLDPGVRAAICTVSVAVVVVYLWMQCMYYLRCRNCMRFLVHHAKASPQGDLRDLGILKYEHVRIILMWTAAFVGILAVVLWRV